MLQSVDALQLFFFLLTIVLVVCSSAIYYTERGEFNLLPWVNPNPNPNPNCRRVQRILGLLGEDRAINKRQATESFSEHTPELLVVSGDAHHRWLR